ncbi:hypothetical protein [Streptomyces sp. NPDC059489]|uniref:hypothetical protein n=1 Tax=Streptomyces sp. NPDC059489 TaxID=3346849 RepID=UPI0036B89105
MNTRATAVGLLAAAALALTACSGSDTASTEPSKIRYSSSEDGVALPITGLTAQEAAAKLADATGVTDLGNPADNTDACSGKAAGKSPGPNDCSQLITTDTVSIYEFDKSAGAARWVTTMKKTGDWRQVGRFALGWTARDQDLTSDDRRAELVAALKKATASES